MIEARKLIDWYGVALSCCSSRFNIMVRRIRYRRGGTCPRWRRPRWEWGSDWGTNRQALVDKTYRDWDRLYIGIGLRQLFDTIERRQLTEALRQKEMVHFLDRGFLKVRIVLWLRNFRIWEFERDGKVIWFSCVEVKWRAGTGLERARWFGRCALERTVRSVILLEAWFLRLHICGVITAWLDTKNQELEKEVTRQAGINKMNDLTKVWHPLNKWTTKCLARWTIELKPKTPQSSQATAEAIWTPDTNNEPLTLETKNSWPKWARAKRESTEFFPNFHCFSSPL